MAKVKMGPIIDHLGTDMRRALEAVLRKHFPDSPHNSHQVFRDFKRAVDRRAGHWVNVPDSMVDAD